MSREALVLLVCCCDFRDGVERLISSKSLRNAVIRAFPGLFRILRMCAPRRAAAVVRPRGREKSADRRRCILISRLLIIRASVPRRKSPFPAYFKGFPAVSPLIPPYPAFLKYPVSPHCFFRIAPRKKCLQVSFCCGISYPSSKKAVNGKICAHASGRESRPPAASRLGMYRSVRPGAAARKCAAGPRRYRVMSARTRSAKLGGTTEVRLSSQDMG